MSKSTPALPHLEILSDFKAACDIEVDGNIESDGNISTDGNIEAVGDISAGGDVADGNHTTIEHLDETKAENTLNINGSDFSTGSEIKIYSNTIELTKSDKTTVYSKLNEHTHNIAKNITNISELGTRVDNCWKRTNLNGAEPDELVLTKVSQLENDANYGKDFATINGNSTYETIGSSLAPFRYCYPTVVNAADNTTIKTTTDSSLVLSYINNNAINCFNRNGEANWNVKFSSSDDDNKSVLLPGVYVVTAEMFQLPQYQNDSFVAAELRISYKGNNILKTFSIWHGDSGSSNHERPEVNFSGQGILKYSSSETPLELECTLTGYTGCGVKYIGLVAISLNKIQNI